jgi:CheY-like chemotaxis protein
VRRALVVDSDEAVRSGVARYLRVQGVQVWEAEDRAAAVDLLRRLPRGRGPEAILAELAPGGLAWEQLLSEGAAYREGRVRGVWMTDAPLIGTARTVLRQSGWPLLLKPFDLSEISTLLGLESAAVAAVGEV